MKKIIFIFCIVILTITAMSCKAKKQKTNPNVSYELIETHSQGGYNIGQFQTITNPIDLKLLYTQLNLSRKPGLPLPKIDFEKESIVALFMGEKLTGGFGINIKSIKRISSSNIEIQIEETEPDGMATMAITSPFAIYKISIPNVETTFVK